MQGPKAEAAGRAAGRRGRDRPSATTTSRSGTVGGRAGASSRAPATPARTASSSTCPPASAERSGSALLDGGPRRRRRAHRARRARHAAARDEVRALRQRHRRDHQSRSRPGSAGWSSRPRATSSAAAAIEAHARGGRRRASWWASRWSSAAVARHGYPVLDGRRAGRRGDLGLLRRPRSSSTSAWATCRAALRRRGHRARRSRSAAAVSAARVVKTPFHPAARQEARRESMANVPADLTYTREHEWAKVEGDRARVGITALRPGAARRRRLRRAAEGRRQGHRDEDLRRGRVGQGGVRPVRAGLGEVVEVNERAHREAGDGQPRSLRRTAG